MLSGSNNPIELKGLLYDQAASENSRRWPLNTYTSQLLNKIATKFQRLFLGFQVPVIKWNKWKC